MGECKALPIADLHYWGGWQWRHNIPRLQCWNEMDDIWDSVNEHLGLDMMDLIIFRTFNEFGVKNRSVFSSQNCTHDIKVSLPAPLSRQQKVEKLPNYDSYVHIMGDIMSQENPIPLCMSLNCGKCNSCSPGMVNGFWCLQTFHHEFGWILLIWVNSCQ